MIKNIFIAHSSDDKDLYLELIRHLSVFKHKNIIQIWDKNIIVSDEDYSINIKKLVNNADILLLLVSIDFIASPFFNTQLLNTILNSSRDIKIIPIIIRHCYWESTNISKFTISPSNTIPVVDSYWNNTDKAFTVIMKELNTIFKNNTKETINLETIEQESEIIIQEHAISKSSPILFKEEDEEVVEDYDKEEDDNEKKYNSTIAEAENYVSSQKWVEAIKKFREVMRCYKEGYSPNIDTIRQKIHICSEELLYIKNIETAQRAFNEKSYKSAVKYFKEALNYKRTFEIEDRYNKSVKLLSKISKKKKFKNQQKETSINQKKTWLNKIGLAIAIIIFIIALVISLFTIHYHYFQKTPEKDKTSEKIDTNTNIIKKVTQNTNKKKKKEEKIIVDTTKTLVQINQQYLNTILLNVEKFVTKKKYITAINYIKSANKKSFNTSQINILNSKTDSIYGLIIKRLKIRTNNYLNKNKYNASYHKNFFNKINSLLSKKQIVSYQRKQLFQICQKLNNIYVNHYITYTNGLVKHKEYEKAKINLRYLQRAIIYPTTKQKQIISKQISDIEKVEKMINRF